MITEYKYTGFDTVTMQAEIRLAINFILLHKYTSSLLSHCLVFVSLEQYGFFPGTRLPCDNMDAVNRGVHPAGGLSSRDESWTSLVQNTSFNTVLFPTAKVNSQQSTILSVFLAGSSFSISTDVHSGELVAFLLFFCQTMQ